MRILHFIDSLDYGGAETLLMGYIPMLTGYEHIVVTLKGPNVYEQTSYEYVQLDLSPARNFFQIVKTIRQLIREKEIGIVHSHSFWTNILSRLATPGHIQLFNHYHFADYDTMRHRLSVKRMIFLDKLIRHRSLCRLAVSEYVGQSLKTIFPCDHVKVIPNFINCAASVNLMEQQDQGVLKIIAVGNCNLEKNYKVVINAFKLLKEQPIHIDIIGARGKLEFYRAEVTRLGLSTIHFCGPSSGVRDLLPQYDLFLSSSVSETFGIAVLEAVCARLPLLLSAIPAFKEIAPGGTIFFNPHDPAELANCLTDFLRKKRVIDDREYSRVLDNYSPGQFLTELKKIYTQPGTVENSLFR